ncbi:MAG: UdgX family uracil-DNA binding protein [Rhodospirillales bacterium]|nr:UdgX family uracil-DNA binding protein [Rhodospirillales bacterium]
MIEVRLSGNSDFVGWRTHARRLLAAGHPPDTVTFRVDDSAPDLFATANANGSRCAGTAENDAFRVPRRFLDLARRVVLHSASDRFSLLYEMVWRMAHGERHLLEIAPDPQVRRVESMVHAVRRDIHKMKAFLRFREIKDAGSDDFYIAWFEPDHHILTETAPFFAERFASMRWSILTPEASAHWDLAALSYGPGASKNVVPTDDALEAYWRTYYASIFNPARLNTAAMKAQMPVKYWKNLPEAALIRPLAAEAGRRTRLMLEAPPTALPKQRHPLAPVRPRVGANREEDTMPAASLDQLRRAAAHCTRCPLWEPATQTVFGEGPADAPLMLVGEQPGDKEDVSGRPFVGPAGAVLDRALNDAGIERKTVYVSNAVKHFKYVIRGTRRLHQKPSIFEIDACRYWLDAEIEAVAPQVIVAMGATAGRGVFSREVKIGRERGRLFELRQKQKTLITVHPSYLLRLPDEDAKEREYARFVDDLKLARHALAA